MPTLVPLLLLETPNRFTKKIQQFATVAVLFSTLLPGHADDADRELLSHGYRQWNEMRDLLITRKEFIQDDLVAVLNSPSWQAREFAAVVQVMAKDPAAFAAETARIADIRGIYLNALGIEDIPQPPWKSDTPPDAKPWIDPLTLALRRRQGPPPAQHIP